MGTIKETYVSFEIASLLNEKGFDGDCRARYDYNGALHYEKYPIEASGAEMHNSILCPTVQMVMKWLRENKKILISIFCHIDKGYWFCIQHFINSPYKFATSESIHRKEEILGKIQYYDTYEQVCEAAIKYCLENLI